MVCNDTLKAELAGTLSMTNTSASAIKIAPIVIVACAEVRKAGFCRGELFTTLGDWFMFGIGLTMENMALAAHASGLGAAHIGNFGHKKVESILGVPEGFCVVEMAPLGCPDGETKTPLRKELAEIVFREKFGVK